MTDIVYRTGDTITALYDTRTSAEAAMEQLRAGGIPDDAISLAAPNAEASSSGTTTGSSTSTTAGTTSGTGTGSGYGSSNLFTGHEDQSSYDEAIRRGGCLVVVSGLSAEDRERAADILEMTDAVDFDEREASWRSEGWTGGSTGSSSGYGSSTGDLASSSYDRTSGSVTGAAGAALSGGTATDAGAGFAGGSESLSGEKVIPVAEEELRIGKRDRSHGRVRVRSYVRETPVSEDVTLQSERVEIDRRPVDRPLEAGDDAFRERTIEAEERSEEAVVDKQARVVEEVTLRKDVETRQETVTDTVRKQDVEVDRDVDPDITRR